MEENNDLHVGCTIRSYCRSRHSAA